MKNSVPPNIQSSYCQSDVICCAGKNTSAIPSEVVRNPLRPAMNIVARPYWPLGVGSVTANFTSAPNAYTNGTNCSTTASESSFWNVSCTPAPAKFRTTNTADTIPCVINAAYGVAYRGWMLPSQLGM